MDNMVSSGSGQEAYLMLSWLLDAGVDTIVADTPSAWLKEPVEKVVSTPPAVAPQPDNKIIYNQNYNNDSDHSKTASQNTPDVLCFGPENAPLGIVLECDPRAGRQRILVDEEMRLLGRMMEAIGQDEANLIRFGLRPETASKAVSSHSAIMHPERRLLLLAGNLPSQTVLGRPLSETRGQVHTLDHATGTSGKPVQVITSFSPHALIRQPSLKALAWADLRLLLRCLKAL